MLKMRLRCRRRWSLWRPLRFLPEADRAHVSSASLGVSDSGFSLWTSVSSVVKDFSNSPQRTQSYTEEQPHRPRVCAHYSVSQPHQLPQSISLGEKCSVLSDLSTQT